MLGKIEFSVDSEYTGKNRTIQDWIQVWSWSNSIFMNRMSRPNRKVMYLKKRKKSKAVFKSLHLGETVNIMVLVAVINNWLIVYKKKKKEKKRKVI